MTPRPVALQVQDLGVTLGAVPVLAGVDLTVTAGETVAVLGTNGAGKSTLVKTLVGLIPPARGQVRVYGADITGPARAVPWHKIGYVPQRVGATTGVPATALEVVASGLLHRRALRPGRDARARCLAALETVGLAQRARESVQVFSGGQQQRVLIARALVRDPDLLILDEPLSGMDKSSMDALAATVGRLRRRGTTVVVVLHELGPLTGLLTRSIVLHAGRIVHDAPAPRGPQELLDEGVREAHPHPEMPLLVPTVPDLGRQW